MVEAVRAAQIYTVVINNSWLLYPDADVLFAADATWWLARDPQVSPTADEFKGLRFISQEGREPSAKFIKPRPIGQGGNSALRAAHWAQDQGAKKILLFGVDLCDNQLTHWHGLYVGKNLNNPHTGTFRNARSAWEAYARETNRPEIINCSQRSALTCFQKMTMDQALHVAA